MKDRREFIKALGRGVILTGLAGVSIALLMRRDGEAAGPCSYDFICNKCRKQKKCNLPEAEKYRKNNS